MPPWPLVAVAVVAGLCLGSYAVTAGLRLSRAEGSVRGRSRCDACGTTLGFAQTVPVLSYAGLRGACRHCAARIDPTHLVGELAGAAIAVSVMWVGTPVRMVALAALGLSLLATATVDAKIRRLPDPLTLAVALAGAALAGLSGPEALAQGLVAALLAAGALLAVRRLARPAQGGVGLGLGDVKLVAALAVWLGPATPVMVAAASVLGLLAAPWLRDAERRIAFGPCLALAAWVTGVLVVEKGFAPWAS